MDHEYSIWGWAKNRGFLGDAASLKSFLLALAEALRLQPLWIYTADVEEQIAKLDRDPGEEESGFAASCILATGTMSIHGWPDKLEHGDEGYFVLKVFTCTELDCNLTEKLTRGVVGATRIDSRHCVLPVPA